MKIKKEIINKIRETQKEKDIIYQKYKTISTILTKEEFKRLKKALKEEKENKLKDWAYSLGMQINNNLEKYFNQQFNKQFEETMLEMLGYYRLAIIYTLHYNDKCKFGGKRIKDVLDDIEQTVDLYRTGEMSPQDYIEQLKKDKIEVHFVDNKEKE